MSLFCDYIVGFIPAGFLILLAYEYLSDWDWSSTVDLLRLRRDLKIFPTTRQWSNISSYERHHPLGMILDLDLIIIMKRQNSVEELVDACYLLSFRHFHSILLAVTCVSNCDSNNDNGYTT